MGKSVTATITTDNTFTEWIAPKDSHYNDLEISRFLNVSISGTWTGIVTLQRRFSDADPERDVEVFTINAEESLFDPETGVEYRIGVKELDPISGICNVRLGA